VIITKAKTTDAIALSELSLRSKAYWGYSPTQIELWKSILTITEAYIQKNSIYHLMDGDSILGYYSYMPVTDKKVILDNLFVAPEEIGKGYGRILLSAFLNQIKNNGFNSILLYSDPHAEAFYLKFGFSVIGQQATSIKNRFIPIMQLYLT